MGIEPAPGNPDTGAPPRHFWRLRTGRIFFQKGLWLYFEIHIGRARIGAVPHPPSRASRHRVHPCFLPHAKPPRRQGRKKPKVRAQSSNLFPEGPLAFVLHPHRLGSNRCSSSSPFAGFAPWCAPAFCLARSHEPGSRFLREVFKYPATGPEAKRLNSPLHRERNHGAAIAVHPPRYPVHRLIRDCRGHPLKR